MHVALLCNKGPKVSECIHWCWLVGVESTNYDYAIKAPLSMSLSLYIDNFIAILGIIFEMLAWKNQLDWYCYMSKEDLSGCKSIKRNVTDVK